MDRDEQPTPPKAVVPEEELGEPSRVRGPGWAFQKPHIGAGATTSPSYDNERLLALAKAEAQ